MKSSVLRTALQHFQSMTESHTYGVSAYSCGANFTKEPKLVRQIGTYKTAGDDRPYRWWGVRLLVR